MPSSDGERLRLAMAQCGVALNVETSEVIRDAAVDRMAAALA